MALTQIPIELSSTPGIVDNSNATAITIDSSERVLIGTDSGDGFNAASTLRLQNTDTTNYIQMKGTTTSTLGLLFGDTDDDFAGGFQYLNTDNSLVITTNNNEALRIDDSGNLLVGTTSTVNSAVLTVDGKINAGTSATGGGVVLENTYSSGSLSSWGAMASSGAPAMCYGLNPKFGTNNAFISSTAVGIPRAAVVVDGDIKFFTGGIQTPAIGSDATVTEKVRILEGGGITFNGDTSASNALDDYEEGTWTPSTGTGTITSDYARYVKIGRLVFVTFEITDFSDITTSTGVIINGLPFTPDSDQIGTGANFHRYISKSGYYGSATTYIPPGGPNLRFYFTGASNWGQMFHSDITSTSAVIYGSFSYYANS